MLHRHEHKGNPVTKNVIAKTLKTYGLQSAEFVALAVHVAVLGPILLTVSLLRTGRPLNRYIYLFRRNVLASYFRARIDYRFGGFHSCARRMNLILTTLEDQLSPHATQRPSRSIDIGSSNPDFDWGDVHDFPGREATELTDEQLTELAPIIAVYANLALCYLKMGSVEGACQVVVRAHNKLGIPSLPTLHDLDHQASQIVLASLAACRILDNGGSATVVVKEGTPPLNQADTRSHSARQNLRKSAKAESNVIPFPSPFS